MCLRFTGYYWLLMAYASAVSMSVQMTNVQPNLGLFFPRDDAAYAKTLESTTIRNSWTMSPPKKPSVDRANGIELFSTKQAQANAKIFTSNGLG